MATELKAREREILLLMAEGRSAKEIAARLKLATDTVRWYNKQIYSKLGVSSREGAVARARELGWLDSPVDVSRSAVDERSGGLNCEPTTANWSCGSWSWSCSRPDWPHGYEWLVCS
jgi:DNA-binding CsgD family transcriptional regulator